MKRTLQTGAGWRLGWDSDAPEYCGLLGGEDWAVELTEPELEEFCRLATQLCGTMIQIAGELMDEEKITCEAESDLIWLEAAGKPSSFELRFMLLKGRRGEGRWSAEAVPSLVQAIPRLRAF